MLVFLPVALLWLLLRPQLVMAEAEAACALFVHSVMPGLFPYMALSLMLVSRLRHRRTPGLLTLLGWCGGSPTGGRLLALCPDWPKRTRKQLAIACSTMSPMFLVGTLGRWLHSSVAGTVILLSVLVGGWLTGLLAGAFAKGIPATAVLGHDYTAEPLTLGQAVEQTARTMLLVCGTMVILRVAAALATEAFPSAALPVTTLLEVTTGAEAIAALPLPLSWKTALLAGATGFGGAAIMMQNRAVWAKGMMSLGEQMLWQGVHGLMSGIIALGMMEMLVLLPIRL